MYDFDAKLFVYRSQYKMSTGLIKTGFTMSEIDNIYNIDYFSYNKYNLEDAVIDNLVDIFKFEQSEMSAIVRTMIEYDWGDVRHRNVKL